MEAWSYNTDRTRASVSGRIKVPLWKKINPFWWWQNDTEQTVDQAAWFHPEWPQWRRTLIWNVFRNPLQNFRAFVVGVQDKNYEATGKAPIDTIQRNDLGERGFQWCVIWLFIPRPFISYSGKRVTWYAGWQISGFFGLKFNIKL